MRVLHCCLSSFYVDNFGYQENILPYLNKEDGHTVKILASLVTYKGSEVTYSKVGSYTTGAGIVVVRLPYMTFFPRIISQKLGLFCKGVLNQEIESFAPDVIFYHGTGGIALQTIVSYKKKHHQVKLYADNHAFTLNTAQHLLSRVVYKMLLNPLLRSDLPYIEKIFYLSQAAGTFLWEFKGIPKEKTEFMPLGGLIPDDIEYSALRKKYRNEAGIRDEQILFVHSGKMIALKKTVDLLKAFSTVKDSRFCLLLLGSLSNETENEITQCMCNDSRIRYLGWQSQDDLRGYLCACDMYLQPGSESATLQNAMCCRCPVMIYPSESHQLYMKGNGYFVESMNDMRKVLQSISNNASSLATFSQNSLSIAKELFDYKKMARRYTI